MSLMGFGGKSPAKLPAGYGSCTVAEPCITSSDFTVPTHLSRLQVYLLLCFQMVAVSPV